MSRSKNEAEICVIGLCTGGNESNQCSCKMPNTLQPTFLEIFWLFCIACLARRCLCIFEFRFPLHFLLHFVCLGSVFSVQALCLVRYDWQFPDNVGREQGLSLLWFKIFRLSFLLFSAVTPQTLPIINLIMDHLRKVQSPYLCCTIKYTHMAGSDFVPKASQLMDGMCVY